MHKAFNMFLLSNRKFSDFYAFMCILSAFLECFHYFYYDLLISCAWTNVSERLLIVKNVTF